MTARRAGALSGALAALSLPPFGVWPLAFVALVPLGLRLSRPLAVRREVVASGLWFGGVFYGVALHWVPLTLRGMMPFGALLGLLAIAVLALTGGFQSLGLHHLLVRRRRSPVLAIPAVWVVAEELLARAGPLAMPWTPLGLSLTPVPVLASGAEWGGVQGLSLWIAMVNGAVVTCLLAAPGRRRYVGAILVAALTSGPVLAGALRVPEPPGEDGPPVWVAQFPMSRAELLDPELRDRRAAESLERIFAMLEEDSRGLEPVAAGIEAAALLLPEAPFQATWGNGVGARIRALAERVAIPVLVGAHVEADPTADAVGAPLRNGVMLVDPDGSDRLVHGKVRLVPGVESPRLSAGPPGGVLRLRGLAAGFALCFEAAFGRDVRDLRRGGAELLVNPSNDGWFSPRLPLLGSAAHAQHRAHLILRAIETRMSAVRSSVGGELLVIRPDGRVSALQGVGEAALLRVAPAVSPVTTPYVRYGDLGGLSGAALLLALALPVFTRTRPRAASDSADRG